MRAIILAYLVHLFTASGLLAGFMALLAIAAEDFRQAMCWMLATLVIDGIDGTFARLARVQDVLPQVSGKTIDYVIDFFTYAILPAYLFYVATAFSETWRLAGSFAMLLSAAIYYGMEGMVSADGKHFVGFPVLWNMVVFVLLFVLPPLPPAVVIGMVFLLAILHFVPILVPYPSRGGRWWGLSVTMVVVFVVSAVGSVWYYPEAPGVIRGVNALSIGYFILVTALDTRAYWAGPQVPG